MRARRTDANHGEIVEALRAEGCSVWPLNDIVDVLIGYGGLTMLGEIKDGDKPLKKGRQQKFHDEWKGGVYLLRRVEDVKPCVETLKGWLWKIRA